MYNNYVAGEDIIIISIIMNYKSTHAARLDYYEQYTLASHDFLSKYLTLRKEVHLFYFLTGESFSNLNKIILNMSQINIAVTIQSETF